MKTTALVHDNLQAMYAPLFRPPYSQRKADSASVFGEKNLKVALWNIDSQDWNNSVSADEASQRVLTLMLLWRHGVILFHDIHSKAQSAVPYRLSQFKDSGMEWMPCRVLSTMNPTPSMGAQPIKAWECTNTFSAGTRDFAEYDRTCAGAVRGRPPCSAEPPKHVKTVSVIRLKVVGGTGIEPVTPTMSR